MRFMLDTNICIYVIKRRPGALIERLGALRVGEVGISTITLAELEYGASKSAQRKRNRQALHEFVSALHVAAFDVPATAAYGDLRASLERKGRPIGSMDLMIAAHAISLSVTVVTNNEREFKRVAGLRVENWAAA